MTGVQTCALPISDNAFKLAASSTRFPTDEYAPIEKRYREAIGQLQKMRPASMGKGDPSAEEEEYARAVRLVTDPGSLVAAFEQGTLTGKQAQLLNTISHDVYKSVEHIVKTVHDERPQAINPRTLNAFRIVAQTSMSNAGLSVGEAQKLTGASAEKPEQDGDSLGTRRPSGRSSIAESASLSTRVGGGSR